MGFNSAEAAFLSTPSARRATSSGSQSGSISSISIHALREEGDALSMTMLMTSRSISIHALREEGDFESMRPFLDENIFLSTPSARRATIRFGFLTFHP